MLSHLARTARPALTTRSVYALRALHTTPRLRQQEQQHPGDPYPLPHTRAHLSGTDAPYSTGPLEPEVDLSDPDLPYPTPLPRDGETLEALRARLVYQSRKRGTLEGDLLMSTFAKENMGKMSEAELKEFDKLLDENDWDTYYWATEKKTPPERWAQSPLLEKLKVHARNEGKVMRRMPDLEMARVQEL